MSWLDGLRQRIAEIVRPRRADEELSEELRDHVAREVDRQLREGAAPDRAARNAALRAGNVHAARELARGERTGRLLEDFVADLRFALRAAWRNRGFTAAVVVSLALGVGGTTAIFSVVNTVLLRPLPYADPDQLYNVRIWWKDFSSTLSPADFIALEARGAADVRVGAYFRPNDGFAMSTPSGPELISGAIITAGLPGVLGVTPIAGPGFSTTPNAAEALIGEKLWRERYGGSAEAIGRPVVLDGDSYTVVGVMPDGFNVPFQRDGAAWLKALTPRPTRRGPFYLHTIVRVAPAIGSESAAARLTTEITAVLRDKYGVEPTWQYRLRPLKETIIGDVRPTLLLLLGAMALVLLIAIVNVTNLFLARGTVRARELAIRASLGAGRGRLARHLLAESALLGTIGGVVGVALALGIHELAGDAAVRLVPRLERVRLDRGLILFALACGIGSGLLAGTLPALRLPWHRLAAFLRDGGRTSGDGPVRSRIRQVLVVAEIALTVAVLSGAMLLAKSFIRLQAVDPGFQPAGVATFRLSLPDDPYENEQRLAAFLDSLEERLRGIPAVKSIAYMIALPPNLLVVSNNYTVEGSPGTQGPSGVAEWNVATGTYFETMGIRLVEGRTFDATDRTTSPPVAIVNESFVRRHYPDGRAIGKRLKGGDWDPAEPWTTIVGVVSDVPYGRGLWGGSDATVYRPYSQNLWVQSPYVAIKAEGDPTRIMPAVQQAVRSIDPNLPLRDAATMDERLRASMMEPRLRGLLFLIIGGLALALSITGIYGVMAYSVNQRRRETAIRRALGARVKDVVGTVLAKGLTLTAAGIVLGTAGALMLTTVLSKMLFQVSPRDPAALIIVAGLLSAAALLACAVPAIRSAGIEPAAVLRDE